MATSADHVAKFTSEMMVKDERVIILQHTKGAVYLLGTHHNRAESAVAVRELIRIVRPHIVAVELCRTNLERFNVLTDDEAQLEEEAQMEEKAQPQPLPPPAEEELAPRASYMKVVPLRLKDKAIGEELLLGLVTESLKYDGLCAHRHRPKRFAMRNPRARRFRVRPKVFHDVVVGGEMTAPFGNFTWTLQTPHSKYLVHGAFNYRILLADKPIEETFCRVAAALSAEERTIIQVYQHNFLKLFVASSASKTIMMRLIEKNVRLYDAIVRERDEYMAQSLRQALEDAQTRPVEKARVIAIMGKKHVDGIVEYWLKVVSRPAKARPSSTKARRVSTKTKR